VGADALRGGPGRWITDNGTLCVGLRQQRRTSTLCIERVSRIMVVLATRLERSTSIRVWELTGLRSLTLLLALRTLAGRSPIPPLRSGTPHGSHLTRTRT
jgi:hypothetical protein